MNVIRLWAVFVITVAVLAPQAAFAVVGPAVLIDTNSTTTATHDGPINAGEYENSTTGINAGFGDVIGVASQLYVEADGTGNLQIALNTFGTLGGGGGTDEVVIYIDSKAGGFSTTSGFSDTADGCRQSISGFDGSRSTINFGPGFEPDFAICISTIFTGLWELANGGDNSLIFKTGITRLSSGNNHELALLLSDLGLVPGDFFRYLATYTNGGFRSNEFNGVVDQSWGSNIGNGTVNLVAGDYNTFVSPLAGNCSETVTLDKDKWKLLSSTCNLGSSDTVDDAFTDANGFADATYFDGTNGDWVVYRRGYGAPDNYVIMDKDIDPLEAGRGYWAKYLGGPPAAPGPTRGVPLTKDVVFSGARNSSPTDVTLQSDAAGRFNMLGHPYDLKVNWPDVRVVENGTTVLTLDQADPGGSVPTACQQAPVGTGCKMSRILYKWNGAAHVSFNDVTPSMEGVLEPGDGFWVEAFAPNLELRIPLVPTRSPTKANTATRSPESALNWQVRLIAAATSPEGVVMRDDGNFLGQLAGSNDQYDVHDLPELAPFGGDYLTIVFAQYKWGAASGDYNSDHRRINGPGDGLWQFEVHTSLEPGTEVTLTWEGPDAALEKAALHDITNNAKAKAGPDGSYTFTVASPVHHFAWKQNAWRKWRGSSKDLQ